uniref:Lipoprotein signal peptidase n=1 Tax=Histophilus somni (strain 129Pt) TaxID=205914 RepID=LSPA_HISS1|nr:RecName: Full=Lipoprotein signal peptidase; AltName: Full=Prolipoprotein signal peptidase; AltName: Full=Signal peptidase II; Short=SPase II [Histophilus somni 129PT]
MNLSKTGLPFLWISAVAFFTDLITKLAVVKNFSLYESINILPFFNLTYVRNHGAAFSFLADHAGWQKYFFILLALVVSFMILFFLYKNQATQKLQNTGYALMVGGALANAADRAYHGFVVDFFDFYWQQWHYPVFNIADVAICIGAGLLAIDAFKQNDKKESKQN